MLIKVELRAEDVVPWVETMPSTHKTLGFILTKNEKQKQKKKEKKRRKEGMNAGPTLRCLILQCCCLAASAEASFSLAL